MADLIEFQIEIVGRFREMRRNYLDNVRKIKDIAKDVFGNRLLSVYVFGALLRAKKDQ